MAEAARLRVSLLLLLGGGLRHRGLLLQEWHMGTDLQREAQIQSAEISLLAILAAIQTVGKVERRAIRLQSLER
eukprot:bmy_20285T0